MSTTGELACTNATEDASNGSSITLNGLANLYDGDEGTVVSQSANGNPSRYALLTFAAPGTAIPAGSTINSWTLRLLGAFRTGSAGSIPGCKAAINGSITGNERGTISVTTTPATITVSGSAVLDGVTPSVAQINAQQLQYAFSLSQTAMGGGRVGGATLEIDYTAPAATDPPNGILCLV